MFDFHLFLLIIINIMSSIGSCSGGASRKRKRVIKDEDILEILKTRDELLAKTTDPAKQEEIHMACKGLFACPKSATDAEKVKCFDAVRSKLKKLGSKLSGGSRRRKSRKRTTRKRSSSRSRRRTRSSSRSRRR